MAEIPTLDEAISRIRREVRDLSQTEWNKVVRAIWRMKELTTTIGQETYGPFYQSFDSLVLKHANAALDRRGIVKNIVLAFILVLVIISFMIRRPSSFLTCLRYLSSSLVKIF